MNVYGVYKKEDPSGLTHIGSIPRKVLDLLHRKIFYSSNSGIQASFAYFQSPGTDKQGFHCIPLNSSINIEERLIGLDFPKKSSNTAMNPSLFIAGNVPEHTDTSLDSDIERERGLLIPISLPKERELRLGGNNHGLNEGGIYILNHHIVHSFNRRVGDIMLPSIFLSATVLVSV